MSSGDRPPSERRRTSSTSSASWIARCELGRRRRRTTTARPCRGAAAAPPAGARPRAASRRARRRRPARAAGRTTRSSMCWASAPGYSPAIVATTWRGRSVVSSAHSTTAPRVEVAAQARRAPQRPRAGVEVRPRAQLLEERAAQVLLDLVLRLLDRHLGERRRRPRGAGTRRRRARAAPSPASSSTAPTISSPDGDRHLRRDAVGHLGGPAAQAGRRRSAAAPRGRPRGTRLRRPRRRARAAARRSPPARRRPGGQRPPRARGRRPRARRPPSPGGPRAGAREPSRPGPRPARRAGAAISAAPAPIGSAASRRARRRVGVRLEDLLARLAGADPDASSTGMTKTFPSPTTPVRACLRIVSTIVCTSLSATTHSIFIFGRR